MKFPFVLIFTLKEKNPLGKYMGDSISNHGFSESKVMNIFAKSKIL